MTKIASFLSKQFGNTTSSLYEKKNAVYYSQMFLFERSVDIRQFKFLKYAK